MATTRTEKVKHEFDGVHEYKNLPPDLAGFQCVEEGRIELGDLLIGQLDGDKEWACGAEGCAIPDPYYRVYRRIPVPSHISKPTHGGYPDPTLTTEKPFPVITTEPVDKLDALQAERGKVYGEPELSHENIGLAWTGILQQHFGIHLPHILPPWIVELMMASFKIQRASRVFHEDNYDDLAVYALKFAKEHQRKDPKAQVKKSS